MENQTEQLNAPTTRETGIRYGLILGLISIVFFVVLAVAGVDTSGSVRWTGLIFTVAVLVLAHKYFKDNGDGFMSFGQGVGIGFWTSTVSSVLSSIFTFIYVKFIDETFIDTMKDNQMLQMQEKGMSDAQIDQAMSFSEPFMTPTAFLAFGIIFGIIIGVIVALIVSIFTQKSNPQALS